MHVQPAQELYCITCIRICQSQWASRRRQLLMAVFCVWSLIWIWFQLHIFQSPF